VITFTEGMESHYQQMNRVEMVHVHYCMELG